MDFGSDLKTEAQGAATSVWCATNSLLNGMGGVYCLDADIAKAVSTSEKMPGMLPWAIDPEAAERLWKLSEPMTGVNFGEYVVPYNNFGE